MNKRNLQIFGWKAYRFEKNHLIGAVLFILVLIGAFWFVTRSQEGTSSVTTSAVFPLPVEQTSQEQTPASENQGQAVQEEKHFIEYGGKCAADVKDAEDDVADVTSYIVEYKQAHDLLKAEREAKIAEIDAQYALPLENAEKRIVQAEQDLHAAQENLVKVRNVCTPP